MSHKIQTIMTVLSIICTVIATVAAIYSNHIAKGMKEIANQANENAEKMLEETVKFSIISAEATWNELMEKYTEVDNKIQQMENSKGLKRGGSSQISRNKLQSGLKRLKLNNSEILIYLKRYDLYQSLTNISLQYQPFKDRISGANFTLPIYPKFPKSYIMKMGGSGSGISIGGSAISIGG